MTNREHLLAVIEPTTGGSGTLELARETIARGGRVTVLMVITDRVRRDVEAYASSAELGRGEAEALALEQLRVRSMERVGGSATLETHHGPIGSDLVKYVSADTTAIAISGQLVTEKMVERIAAYSGRPVIVVPQSAAMASTGTVTRLAS